MKFKISNYIEKIQIIKKYLKKNITKSNFLPLYENYLNTYIQNLKEDDLKLLELLSEYLLILICNTISWYTYIYQFYYSKHYIRNSVKQIPDYVSKENKSKLKFTASYILHQIIYKGFVRLNDNLFYF